VVLVINTSKGWGIFVKVEKMETKIRLLPRAQMINILEQKCIREKQKGVSRKSSITEHDLEMIRMWITRPFWCLFPQNGSATNSLPTLKRLNFRQQLLIRSQASGGRGGGRRR